MPIMCLYMSNAIENTLAIPPLLSPKTALANTKTPANIANFVRPHQTGHRCRPKVNRHKANVRSSITNVVIFVKMADRYQKTSTSLLLTCRIRVHFYETYNCMWEVRRPANGRALVT